MFKFGKLEMQIKEEEKVKYFTINIKVRRCGMIGNYRTLPQRPNDEKHFSKITYAAYEVRFLSGCCGLMLCQEI